IPTIDGTFPLSVASSSAVRMSLAAPYCGDHAEGLIGLIETPQVANAFGVAEPSRVASPSASIDAFRDNFMSVSSMPACRLRSITAQCHRFSNEAGVKLEVN